MANSLVRAIKRAGKSDGLKVKIQLEMLDDSDQRRVKRKMLR